MSEPSKAAISKACELLNRNNSADEYKPEDVEYYPTLRNVALYIDKVSEVAKKADSDLALWLDPLIDSRKALSELILKEPADPLAQAVDDAWVKLPGEWTRETFVKSVTDNIMDGIAKRGGKIVWEAD